MPGVVVHQGQHLDFGRVALELPGCPMKKLQQLLAAGLARFSGRLKVTNVATSHAGLNHTQGVFLLEGTLFGVGLKRTNILKEAKLFQEFHLRQTRVVIVPLPAMGMASCHAGLSKLNSLKAGNIK